MARVSLYVAYKSRIINGVLASYTYVLSSKMSNVTKVRYCIVCSSKLFLMRLSSMKHFLKHMTLVKP